MKTDSLDACYASLLQLGFIVLKQAIAARNDAWVNAEIEMLHNVPSLIGEENLERHRHYWYKERTHYIDWVSAPGREQAKSRMLTYYQTIWNEMEHFIPAEQTAT